MIYIGIDNGVTNNGIGAINSEGVARLYPLPVKKELSYTKEAKHISRIDFNLLCMLFGDIVADFGEPDAKVGLERPMVNSTRFNASMSAVRALEATLIALERAQLAYEYIDSKEWQKHLLPTGIKGSDELKKASLDIGRRLFPQLNIKKDADGLLIAEFLRRKNQNLLKTGKNVAT
jgi:hypothetical protein